MNGARAVRGATPASPSASASLLGRKKRAFIARYGDTHWRAHLPKQGPPLAPMRGRAATMPLMHHEVSHLVAEDLVQQRLTTGRDEQRIQTHQSSLEIGAPQR